MSAVQTVILASYFFGVMCGFVVGWGAAPSHIARAALETDNG
jgi:hypothetical protein